MIVRRDDSAESPQPECYFCARTKEAATWSDLVVYSDELILASHQLEAQAPTYLGTVVIQTVRHTDSGLSELTDEEGRRIGLLVARLSRALKAVHGAAWTYTYCFTEGYRQVHQFVVARYPSAPRSHLRLDIASWEDAPRGGRAEVGELVRRLRANLDG